MKNIRVSQVWQQPQSPVLQWQFPLPQLFSRGREMLNMHPKLIPFR